VNPAFSILFFTTLAGAAQGLVLALALAVLSGITLGHGFLLGALALAELLLVAGLAASFLHLGRKTRAWRAVLMWRTSWMSREVIVLPAFIGLVAIWWLMLRADAASPPSAVLMPIVLLAGALALWYCTAMIYACLRFIQEWAHPLTAVNFTLIGVSSGLVLACALATLAGEATLLRQMAPWALTATLAAWCTRTLALRRNATLRHKSTLQSATGIKSDRLVQTSMGMSAGAFNTREFFHGVTMATLANIKWAAMLFCFALPAVLLVWGIAAGAGVAFVLALVVQAPGLLADRWCFFAQAKHPQNLYYQVVS